MAEKLIKRTVHLERDHIIEIMGIAKDYSIDPSAVIRGLLTSCARYRHDEMFSQWQNEAPAFDHPFLIQGRR